MLYFGLKQWKTSVPKSNVLKSHKPLWGGGGGGVDVGEEVMMDVLQSWL